jgi:protein-L-isoaspartate(D-aspartate) O-methyltransferase
MSELPLPAQAERLAQQRRHMVRHQLMARGIHDSRVLQAMLTVPRHQFVAQGDRDWAYQDRPLHIGHEQTISQPYIVAYMTEQAAIAPHHTVLEIGTGCGYQTAVLATLAQWVYSVEIVDAFVQPTRNRLRHLGYDNVSIRHGNGYAGWAEHAPYDAIVVTAAPPTLPDSLVEQLAISGHLVVPVGYPTQTLQTFSKRPSGLRLDSQLSVRFVPMVNEDP